MLIKFYSNSSPPGNMGFKTAGSGQLESIFKLRNNFTVTVHHLGIWDFETAGFVWPETIFKLRNNFTVTVHHLQIWDLKLLVLGSQNPFSNSEIILILKNAMLIQLDHVQELRLQCNAPSIKVV